MFRKIAISLLAIGFLFTPLAMAGKGSGCGLGKTLFEGKSGVVNHTLASTTNGTSGNQSFGITFGTSGCDADSTIQIDKEQEVFVAINMDNLSQEMAQGSGQYLDSLAGLMGCSTVVYKEFAIMAQSNYGKLFKAGDTDTAFGS